MDPTSRPSRPTLRDPELYRQVLNRRLRHAFIAGAEERARREFGRPLTSDELRCVLARYPGDVQ